MLPDEVVAHQIESDLDWMTLHPVTCPGFPSHSGSLNGQYLSYLNQDTDQWNV